MNSVKACPRANPVAVPDPDLPRASTVSLLPRRLLWRRATADHQAIRRAAEDAAQLTVTSITWFTNVAAVRGFAGADYEQAVVEEAARQALSRWDERVSHHEVAVDLRREGGCT